jgi:hypothetical protein
VLRIKATKGIAIPLCAAISIAVFTPSGLMFTPQANSKDRTGEEATDTQFNRPEREYRWVPDTAKAKPPELFSQTHPGQVFSGPSADSFRGCELRHNPGGPAGHADPLFILRLKDTDGPHYGFTDNYSLPFPTPWVTQQGGTCSPLPNHCVIDSSVYSYEHALLGVSGIVSHQFKVYELTKNYKGNPMSYEVATQQWFYNGTQDPNHLDRMNSVTSSYAAQPHVKSRTLRCTYVLQVAQNGVLVYSGFHAAVAQTHGPIKWPH